MLQRKLQESNIYNVWEILRYKPSYKALRVGCIEIVLRYFFPGWPWYFHFCLVGFPMRSFFPWHSGYEVNTDHCKSFDTWPKIVLRFSCFFPAFFLSYFPFNFCLARSENTMVSPKILLNFSDLGKFSRQLGLYQYEYMIHAHLRWAIVSI